MSDMFNDNPPKDLLFVTPNDYTASWPGIEQVYTNITADQSYFAHVEISEYLFELSDLANFIVADLRANRNLRIAVLMDTWRHEHRLWWFLTRRCLPGSRHDWDIGEIYINRSSMLSDPSVKLIGRNQGTMGSRFDKVYVYSSANRAHASSNEARRDSLAEVLSRLTENAKVVYLDLGHAVEHRDGYWEALYPSTSMVRLQSRGRGIHWYQLVEKVGSDLSVWPEKYPPEEIKKLRNMLGPKKAYLFEANVEAYRAMLLQPLFPPSASRL